MFCPILPQGLPYSSQKKSHFSVYIYQSVALLPLFLVTASIILVELIPRHAFCLFRLLFNLMASARMKDKRCNTKKKSYYLYPTRLVPFYFCLFFFLFFLFEYATTIVLYILEYNHSDGCEILYEHIKFIHNIVLYHLFISLTSC